MSFVFVYTFILKGDLGRRDVSVETEAPPTEAPKQPAPPPPSVPGVWEESEAKLRERLIERTKKLRVAVTDKILILPDTEPPAQVYTLYIIHIHCISSIYTVYHPYILHIHRFWNRCAVEALTIGEEVMNSFWHFVVLAEFVFSLEVKTEESTLIPT